jgi:hypothetical protein
VAGGVGVLDVFRAPPVGTIVVAGGIEDREVVDLALVGGGLEDGITRILERVVSIAGGATVAADVPLEPVRGAVVASTEVALLNLGFLDARFEASTWLLVSIFGVEEVASLEGVSSNFRFLGVFDFSFSFVAVPFALGDDPSKLGTPWFNSPGVENKLLNVEPMSPRRLAAISASAAAWAACSRANVSRLSFLASFNFMPRLLIFVSSTPEVSAVASLLRVSFPGT